MKNYKVLLYSKEAEFVIALMNYINRKPQIPILAMAFTKMEDVEQYLEEHRPDLMVMEPCAYKAGTIPVLWMLEDRVPEEGTLEGGVIQEELQAEAKSIYVISRYSPASVYVRQMLRILSEQTPFIHREGGASCIGVYSPLGRCGKTTLAKALCRYYSSEEEGRGRQCIYFGWEEFAEYSDGNRSMEELLYYIKQRSENISVRMKTLAVEEQGYECIPSAASYQELRELKKEDVDWLFQRIRIEGCYDRLVVDIGSGCLSDLRILTVFDAVYLPELTEEYARRKLETFCSCMEDLGCRDAAEHIFPVSVGNAGLSSEGIRDLERNRREGVLKSIMESGDRSG